MMVTICDVVQHEDLILGVCEDEVTAGYVCAEVVCMLQIRTKIEPQQ